MLNNRGLTSRQSKVDMPAYVVRIILFMAAITLSSFVYELHFSNKAIEVTGVITSITSKAKGREITISFSDSRQTKRVLKIGVGPIIDLIVRYDVGDKIAIIYCRDCYPEAKIGDVPNTYSLTFMILLLDCIIFSVFAITRWNRKDT